MALKDILVQVDDRRGATARIEVAAALAGAHGAHVAGLFVIEPINFAGIATPMGATGAYETVLEQHLTWRRAVGEALGEKFIATVEGAGGSAEWRIVVGDPGRLVPLHARYADLAVLAQSDPDDEAVGAGVAELALLGSGRPVLVVPYIGARAPIGRRVLAAWNATREAARAINDALPLLARADSVTVLSIDPRHGIAGDGDLPAADIALHLARHGVRAEAAYTVAEGVGVGDIILSRAADLGADLIVMGGYGHSRLRELALGGATRTMLQEMTVPVLLSH
ncbi:MAG TPA: universal stress protein [Stellaceae bacterium]|nr:universal stress protein [Stellaceae bacterium]